MSNSKDKILFIFEGSKTEKSITDNLINFFVNENLLVTCAYCTTIYKMYGEISADEDLDTFSLLKEIDENREILKKYKRSDFAQIYMFFDYDGHASNASDEKLKDLLSFFNEETEKGKLYVSYPMVEAVKHIENFNTFQDLKVDIKDLCNYKNIVSNNCISTLKHFHLYDLNTWKSLINAHLKKLNYIVNDLYEYPKKIIDQTTVFDSQIQKYISINQTVAILSAFSVFLHDYYGNEELKKQIE